MYTLFSSQSLKKKKWKIFGIKKKFHMNSIHENLFGLILIKQLQAKTRQPPVFQNFLENIKKFIKTII